MGAGDDPEGGYSEADDSEDWSSCEGDDPGGYDPEYEGSVGDTTDADAYAHAGVCNLLRFLRDGDGEGDDDDDDYV